VKVININDFESTEQRNQRFLSEDTKAILSDIDGSILYHYGSLEDIFKYENEPVLLPGVAEKFREWKKKGYVIYLMTARPQTMKSLTIRQLEKVGIYHMISGLWMGLPHGERILLNDTKPTGKPSGRFIELKRDKGLKDIDI
jgi:phosphatidate phosphatase PAH1